MHIRCSSLCALKNGLFRMQAISFCKYAISCAYDVSMKMCKGFPFPDENGRPVNDAELW